MLPLVVLLLLLLAAPASAAPLATDASEGPIAASGNAVAWSTWDAGAKGYRLVVKLGDAAPRTLPVAASRNPFALSAGTGPDLAPWLVWSRCLPDAEQTVRACGIEGWDLGTNTVQRFPFAAKPGVRRLAPSIDGDRLAYVTGDTGGDDALAQVHLAHLDGTGDHVVRDAVPATTCETSIFEECHRVTYAVVHATALHGDTLAVSTRVATDHDDYGACGVSNVRVLSLASGAARVVDTAACGMSGATLDDLSFAGDGTLWWDQLCGDDQGACIGGNAGPFRAVGSHVERLVREPGFLLSTAVQGATPLLSTGVYPRGRGCPGPADASPACGHVEAVPDARFKTIRSPQEHPASGFLTVRARHGLRILRPPSSVSCGNGLIWAGFAWHRGSDVVRGPAVPVTVSSGHRRIRDVLRSHTVQSTLAFAVSAGCGRTWTLTYRPRGQRPVRFRVRVLSARA